jgi:hypothetical protein
LEISPVVSISDRTLFLRQLVRAVCVLTPV